MRTILNCGLTGRAAVTDPADVAEQAAACRALWAAVALTALEDGYRDPSGEAGQYLRAADFRAVCDLAGLESDAVHVSTFRRAA